VRGRVRACVRACGASSRNAKVALSLKSLFLFLFLFLDSQVLPNAKRSHHNRFRRQDY